AGNVERFGVPTPVRKLTRKAWLTDTEFQFVKEHTDRPIKITMPSPSMFLNCWTHGRSDLAYSTQEAFLDDLIAIMNDDAKALAAAGATYLQIDAPQYTYLGDAAVRPDVKDPATELRRLLANDRRVLEGVSGIVSGLHLCRGNYVPIERLALSTQCGFASVDEGNAITRDAQRAKLELVVRTAERVWGGIPAKPRRP